MTQEPSDLDKLFKKKLYTYEEAPLANSWEKISNRLPEQDKVRSFLFLFYSSSIKKIIIRPLLKIQNLFQMIHLQLSETNQ